MCAFSEISYFCDLYNPDHLVFRPEFCGTAEHSSLKSIKLIMSRENWDEWNPLSCPISRAYNNNNLYGVKMTKKLLRRTGDLVRT